MPTTFGESLMAMILVPNDGSAGDKDNGLYLEWALRDSNPRPSRCKHVALTPELNARGNHCKSRNKF